MLLRIGRTYPKPAAAIGMAVVAILAVTAVAMTSADASAERGGERHPEDLPNCFAAGIDQVGRGDVDAGVAIFEGCFTDDYTFEFAFSPEGPFVVCPGPDCPVQDFSSRAELRAQFAAPFFENAGYVATQHQMLNVNVTRQHRGEAEVFAYIEAAHFLPDNSVDIGWNDYTIQAVRERGRWKVEREVIVGTAFLNFAGTPVGT